MCFLPTLGILGLLHSLNDYEMDIQVACMFWPHAWSREDLQHLLKEMKARSAGREDLDALLQEAEQEVTGLLKTSDGDETDGI